MKKFITNLSYDLKVVLKRNNIKFIILFAAVLFMIILVNCDFSGGVDPDITFKTKELSQVEVAIGQFVTAEDVTVTVSKEMEGNYSGYVMDAMPAGTYDVFYRVINILEEWSDWYLAHGDYVFEENYHYTIEYTNDSIWIFEAEIIITSEFNG